MNDRTILKTTPGARRYLKAKSNLILIFQTAMIIAVDALTRLAPQTGSDRGNLSAGKTLVRPAMNKSRVKAIFAAAERRAENAVITQFGYYDEFDPRIGEAYDKVFYAYLAERCPDVPLDDLVKILNS